MRFPRAALAAVLLAAWPAGAHGLAALGIGHGGRRDSVSGTSVASGGTSTATSAAASCLNV